VGVRPHCIAVMRAKPTNGIGGCSNPIENRSSARPYEASQSVPQMCCEYGNVALLLRLAFGDDVPVPGTGLALQLLLQRQQLEAGE